LLTEHIIKVIDKGDFDSMWLDPPAIFRPAPFWSWNARLKPERLCRQIESMHAAGMGGFFMHSRYGLKTEYLGDEWFECISACIDKARQLDMKAYLYDEDRWPSGPAGGLITRKHKNYRMRYLVAGDPERLKDRLKSPQDRLGLFRVELDKNGLLKSYESVEKAPTGQGGENILAFDVCLQRPRPWENDGTYLDTMNPDAVAEFIRVTHQAYRKRYGHDFGGVIPAIFTDEPNYGLAALLWFKEDIEEKYRIHWTTHLPEEFEKRRGYSLLPFLPELVFPRDETRFSEVVYDYYRTITELFVQNFTARIGNWCRENNIALTGHVLFEETVRAQIGAVGAAMPHYEHMHWPGIDILTDQTTELATAKQCSSVADQLGKERVLTELYGCTGWDWPLEGHKFIADWQFAAGINFLCPHLSHYSLAGGAKRDYPASIIDHSPWWKYYRTVNDYLARVTLMLTQGRPVRDVLLIHPIETAWGLFNYFTDKYAFIHNDPESDGPLQLALDSIIFALTSHHYDWDFADESLLAKYGKAETRHVRLGRMKYKLVVVPPVLTLRSSTVEILRDFLRQGGCVLFVDSRPDRIDGRINDQINELIEKAKSSTKDANEFIKTVSELLPRRLSITQDHKEQTCVWSMLRKLDQALLLFVQSHDRKRSHNLKVQVADAKPPVVFWDPLTGKKTELKTKVAAEYLEFQLLLPPSGSALITLGVQTADVQLSSAELKVVDSKEIEGPFEVFLSEPNTLPLDYCTYRFADRDFSQPLPTLKVDELVRAKFGLESRLGDKQQPWYLYSKGVLDTAPRGRVQMLYSFHVTDMPPSCWLVVERPEDYRITINGKPAPPVTGYWVDEDLRKIDITGRLQTGENEICLHFDYRPDMELEDMYVLGDFAVTTRNPHKPPAPGNMTVIAPVKQLNLGSWVSQGLDFYSGSVNYKVMIDKPVSGCRIRIRLAGLSCTAAAIHVGDRTFVLPWPPFEVDITEALKRHTNEVLVEVIGGRKNILGPLHVPSQPRTGPETFSPDHPKWTRKYILNDHGLFRPIIVETLMVKAKR